jgi:hypothetical protein
MTVRVRLGAVLVAVGITAGCAPIDGALGIHDAPTAAATQGSVPQARAEELTAELFQAKAKAIEPGAAGTDARKAVYDGVALTAANAEARLADTLSAQVRAELKSTGDAPQILAVSTGTAYPRQIVARTTLAKSGLPVLHLLVAKSWRSPYQLVASARMVPGSAVSPFDPISDGSAPLGDGAGLVISPEEILKTLPASMNYPTAADRDPRIAQDPWTSQLLASVKDKAKALKALATISQTHVGRGVLGGLRSAAGQGALVFVALERQDVLLNRTGATITPTKAFTALSKVTSVKSEAATKTLEFLVLQVPESGTAAVVAASEQIFAAEGR